MKVIVVGGGAAGMMAALAAAESGSSVTLIEHNEKLGKKIYITGKGRCNLTNACTVEELISHVYRGGKFLYSAFYDYGNSDVMEFFEKNACPLKIERGNRVFPVSDHASDITKVLSNRLKSLGVEVKLDTAVTSVKDEGGYVKGVFIKGVSKTHVFIPADRVILTTGGLSYKTTGSDGSGYKMASALGHAITPLRPSLTSFIIPDIPHKSLEGLSLKNVVLSVTKDDNETSSKETKGSNSSNSNKKKKKKPMFSEMGELLFTSKGISGPLVLKASGLTETSDIENGITAHIDLKPALDMEMLDKRLLRDFNENPNKKLVNVLRGLYPARLAPVMIQAAGLSEDIPIHEVTAVMRKAITDVTKDWHFPIGALGGYEEAVITKGGVSLKEIDPHTMESKLVSGLYFAGEIIDADAQTGGYNLQIAWSTGHLAGKSAAL